MALDRRRFLGALLVGAALALPGVSRGQDQPAPGGASVTKLTLSVPGMT